MPSLYDVPLTTLAGETTSLAPFKGKALLIVNVASKCGFTPQYTGLESLYTQFQAKGLEVLGFPANDFAGQEPGTDAEIAAFCSTEYPVSFPLFSKSVVTGDAKSPLYRILISSQPTPTIANGDELRNHLAEYAAQNSLPGPNEAPELLWNFEKFLVGRDGQVLSRATSDVAPDDPRLVAAIESALSSGTTA